MGVTVFTEQLLLEEFERAGIDLKDVNVEVIMMRIRAANPKAKRAGRTHARRWLESDRFDDIAAHLGISDELTQRIREHIHGA